MKLSRPSTWQNISRGAIPVLAVTLLTMIGATRPALAQTETILYNFCSVGNCTDGAFPLGGLIADKAGNLYGTTRYGGNAGGGIVFRLTPAGDESVLYSFHAGFPHDGYQQYGLLTMDQQGSLYGTSSMGGANSIHVARGDGTAFKLSPDGTETILHNFGAFNTDGVEPIGGMVMDAKGNLYGTTYIGGIPHSHDYGTTASGTVFRLTPAGEETIIHDFANDGTDGGNPWGPLIMDRQGNLYGTTPSGGDDFRIGSGTVFEITAAGSYRILHIFTGPPSDGASPFAGLTLDSHGNLYGATYGSLPSGGDGAGTVFKLTPGSDGSWQETILYKFSQQSKSCQNPDSNVVFDAERNLYGTTRYGGGWGQGCVYEISPAGKLTVLHEFGEGSDGAQPMDNVLFSQGNLYGTTYAGGNKDSGTVFRITP